MNLMVAFASMCDRHPPSSGEGGKLHKCILEAVWVQQRRTSRPRRTGLATAVLEHQPLFPRTGVPPCTQIIHVGKPNINTEGGTLLGMRAVWIQREDLGETLPTWSAREIQADPLWGQGSDVCAQSHWETWGRCVSYFLGQLGENWE